MTNREHMIVLLQSLDDSDSLLYIAREFGCSCIPFEECVQHDDCCECWKHWLESEVKEQ